MKNIDYAKRNKEIVTEVLQGSYCKHVGAKHGISDSRVKHIVFNHMWTHENHPLLKGKNLHMKLAFVRKEPIKSILIKLLTESGE